MDSDSIQFANSYYGETTLNPVGLAAIIILGIAMLLLPRRYAVWPMIFTACFIAPAQRVALFSLNFDLLRIMVVFGSVRLLMRREWTDFQWKSLDSAVVAWVAVGTVAYVILLGSADAIKYKLGIAYDALGLYFLFRCLIRGWNDVEMVTAGFVFASVPVAVAFLIEHATGHNLFAFLGGVPAVTDIRDGRLRCQGAFAHPILAGCFWAAVLPFIVVRWWSEHSKRSLTVVGTGCSCLVIILCASSTPVAAMGCAAFGAIMFRLRRRMRSIRWGVVVILCVLQVLLTNPVWHLMIYMDFVGGSTGWHRYHLIDEAIKHFGEWWFVGTTSTAHWGYGLEDVTNQYVLEGVRGGVVTLALFLVMIALAFAAVGRLWRAGRTRYEQLLGWTLGVALFVHCTSFSAVSYFGQIYMLWYLTLAIIGSLAPIKIAQPSSTVSQPQISRRALRSRSIESPSSAARLGHR